MIMKGRLLYILLVALWLLSGSQVTYAFTYGQASEPASWGRTATLSDDVRPSYSFRSTSSYTPVVGSTSYLSDGSGPISSPRRAKSWDPWDEPEDDPIGVVPNPAPLGEPLILLLLALGYFLCVRLRMRCTEK